MSQIDGPIETAGQSRRCDVRSRFRDRRLHIKQGKGPTIALAAALLALCSCGGGGGSETGESSTIAIPTETQEAPSPPGSGDSTGAATSDDQPTWILKDKMGFDAFTAPFAQAACDTLDRWRAPAETTSEEVSNFSSLVKILKEMVGSPADSSFSDTYWEVLALADAALEYEREHPEDTNSSWSVGTGMHKSICSSLNLNERNSRFGALPDGKLRGDKAPNTTVIPSTTTVSSPSSGGSNRIFSKDDFDRLILKCLDTPGCRSQEAWFRDFLGFNFNATTRTHTSNRACISYFSDLITFLDSFPSRDELTSWNDANWSRCKKD